MTQMISLISIFHLIVFALCRLSNDCSDGSITEDQELRVGSPLELTCTLKNDIIAINGKNHYVNASYLTFKNKNDHYFDRAKIQVVGTLKSKLRIESSKVEDSGVYFCVLILENSSRNICASKVSIGYEPQKSSINFTCTSDYQELKCQWMTEPSELKTDSMLKEKLVARRYKMCPNLTRSNYNTHWMCKWTRSSLPQYSYWKRKLEFTVRTNNSLGEKSDDYHIDHYEIVLPSKPQRLIIQNITQNWIEISWSSPENMKIKEFHSDLLYQIAYKPYRVHEWKVINITEKAEKIFYNITDLVPNTLYNITVRCRSPSAKGENMWSKNETINVKTKPDVPYFSPNVTEQAFEVKKSRHSRKIIIHWEPVSKEYWNGEGFHYIVNYSTHMKREEETALYFSDKVYNMPYATFDNLDSNSAYYFKIFSANSIGYSRNFSSIRVDNSEKLPNVPEDIAVISLSHGYNISWKPPSINSSFIKSYTLFWCDEILPRPSPCRGSIHWKHTTKTNELLNITDEKNFHFAVAANSDKSTSGMEWALCVAPYNIIQDRVQDFSVYTQNSTSLHVTWKLHCNSQRAVIKEFQIIYCKTDSNRSICIGPDKSKRISNNSAEDYYITDLVSLTWYRIYIKILAFSGHFMDSEFKFQQTLPGAPDDPPRDVKILRFTNSTIEIAWKPPRHPNGVITSYILIYNSFSNKVNISKIVLKNNIKPFTNYSIQLKACVGEKCSSLTKPVYVLTEVGIPGIMDEPRIEVVNTSFATVYWNAPLHPNGPIDYYLLYLKPSKDYNAFAEDASYAKTVNVTGTVTSYLVDVECPMIGKGIRYSFQLQPVNMLYNNILLPGLKTKPTNTLLCVFSSTEGLSSEMIISIIVGSAIGCAILLIVIYMFIRWMKKKYDLLKQIKVRLPMGLDTPNRCTPGTYQDFKKDLLQHCPYTAQVKQISGSFVLDAKKNRHGSGNSQYSNISSDELLIKKTSRCDTYRRNPSGDSSSGCSSSGGHDSISSSNTNQTHVSIDSGAEIDFPSLSARDSVFSEQNSIHKLMTSINNNLEISDDPSSDKVILSFRHPYSEKDEILAYELEKKLKIPACSSTAKNFPLLHPAYLQPYSKFGLNKPKHDWTNHCSRQNMLAYVSSLAYSEPSVAELDSGNNDHCNSNLMPYSKLTFSKSLENLHENHIGYSKCGIIDDSTKCCFTDSVKLLHNTTINQNCDGIKNISTIIPAKQDYVSIETCLENRNKISECNKILHLEKDVNDVTSHNVSDNIAYSKFDIKPLGVLSTDLKANPKTDYIPIQQANYMLSKMDVSHITSCSPFDVSSGKELCLSNVSLPADIMVSAIIDPCIEQRSVNGLNSVPVDLCDSVCLCTNHIQDQEITPVSFCCDGTKTDENQNTTALNEKGTEQHWNHTSLPDINLTMDAKPENRRCDKPKSGEEVNTDHQTSVQSNYLRELEVVVSPGKLNYSTASVPAYRFQSQSNKVDTITSKNHYVHITPVYHV